MTTLREAAQQALEALVSQFDGRADAIDILSAALAEQAQPMSEAGWLHRLDMEKSEAWMAGYAQGQKRAAEQAQPVAEVGWAAGRPNTIIEYRWLDWDHPPEPGMTLFATPPAPQSLTIERLRDALVASRVIDLGAVEDPDNYDDGVTRARIEALHRRIT